MDKWLNTTDTLLPTINQVKSIASCLHIPFAGFYMNPEHVKLKAIPAVKNYRTLYGGVAMDDSAINIAMMDLLRERDFLLDSSKENDISLPTFNLSITIREDPVLWARKIRELFDMEYGLTVITEENKTSPKKIPAVCKAYNIPCVNITELCTEEN